MSIYHSCYNLLNTYIFGGSVSVGSYEELVCILVASIACLFLVAMPFIIVWNVIRRF